MKKLLALLIVLATTLLTAQEVEITAEPHHHLALENAYVRVFKVEVPPHASTLVHRHRHDYIFVTIGASDVESDAPGKPPVHLRLQDGDTEFTSAPLAHAAKNLADTPFRNVTIELLKDEDARNHPPLAWNPERGLSVLHGGTLDILFVKDGVRVSETELQPGGVVPKHTHTGPHLLVAVSDLDLEVTAPGKSPTHLQLKSGDIKWFEGGITHTVTNVGKQQAKMVTLEFH